MAYAFEDQRYYPRMQDGGLTYTQAYPTDTRTMRMREYLDQAAAEEAANTSMQTRIAEAKAAVEKALSAPIPEVPKTDTSLLGFLKQYVDGMEPLDYVNLPFWTIGRLQRFLKPNEPRREDYPDHRSFSEAEMKYLLSDQATQDMMGIAGASAPLKIAKAAIAAKAAAPKAAKAAKAAVPEAQWSQELAMNDPLNMYLDRLSGGYHSTPTKPKPPTTRPPGNEPFYAEDMDAKTAAQNLGRELGIGENPWLEQLMRDTGPGGAPWDSEIVQWLGNDAALRAAVKKDPDVLRRLAMTNSPQDVGINTPIGDAVKSAFARSTNRPPRSEIGKGSGGGYYYAEGPGTGTQYVPDTVVSRLQSMEAPGLQAAIEYAAGLPGKAASAGSEVIDKIKSIGQRWFDESAPNGMSRMQALALKTLEEKGLLPDKAKSYKPGLGSWYSDITPAERAQYLNTEKGGWERQGLAAQLGRVKPWLEDIGEDYGWLGPLAKVAAAGYGLSKILPPLPSTNTAPSKFDNDPNYVARDINDPEGLMTARRRAEQQMAGDSPWKVVSEMFPWNW